MMNPAVMSPFAENRHSTAVAAQSSLRTPDQQAVVETTAAAAPPLESPNSVAGVENLGLPSPVEVPTETEAAGPPLFEVSPATVTVTREGEKFSYESASSDGKVEMSELTSKLTRNGEATIRALKKALALETSGETNGGLSISQNFLAHEMAQSQSSV